MSCFLAQFHIQPLPIIFVNTSSSSLSSLLQKYIFIYQFDLYFIINISSFKRLIHSGMNSSGHFANNRSNQRNYIPCRYGVHCRKRKQGACTFSHEDNEDNHANYHMMPRQEHQRGQNHRFPRNNSRHHKTHYDKGYDNQERNNHFSNKKPQACLNFHRGEECPHNPCKFKHEYIFNQPEALKKYFYFRGIPEGFNKLSKIQSGNQIFFIIRSNSKVDYFEYSPLENKINPANEIFQIQPELSKRNFYYHHENFIYYAFQNQKTSCYSMGIYNISTSQLLIVQNCHTAPITGIIHYNQSVLLSSCMDGKLKYWTINEESIVINQASTDYLQQKINEGNSRLSILFLSMDIIKQIKIISVGLSDGRLGLFLVLSEDEMSYKEFQFDNEMDANILKIRYRQTPNNISVYILSWSKDKSTSSIISTNINQETPTPLRISSSHEKDKCLAHLEIIDKYLIIGNIKGEVMLYDLEDHQMKGIVINRNPVADILALRVNIVETGVQMTFMAILQENSEEQTGSIGIYKFI